MKLPARIRRLIGDGMAGDVIRLVSGTLTGRLIAVAAMPVITRLYSPADFGLLATYLGIVSLVSVIACLRLDIAIPVARDHHDAAHLLVLALLSAWVVSLLGIGLVIAIPDTLAGALGRPEMAPWLWLVPLGILAASCFSALQWWATRAKRFGSIAVTRITQAAMGAVTTLSLGFAGFAPLGLLLGNLFNSSAGSVRLLVDALRRDRINLKVPSLADLLTTLRRYARFPLISAPEALVGAAGLQLPILMIAALAGREAGFLLLAQQVMALPMSLLGSSIGQVYVSRAPEKLAEGTLAEFTAQTMSKLAAIGLGPVILLGCVAPFVFTAVFGSDWARSGEIMKLMALWMALQFMTSPVSTVMLVTNRQHILFALTVFGLVSRLGMTAAFFSVGPEHAVTGLIIGSVIYYATMFVVASTTAGFRRHHYTMLARGVLAGRTALYVVPICAVYVLTLFWSPL